MKGEENETAIIIISENNEKWKMTAIVTNINENEK
jgi:hypothetical protein